VPVLIEAALESTIEIGAADPSSFDRLEACDFSVEGGRTPLEMSLREMTSVAKHPVQVLIRPRGGAFIYGDAELTVMERQIDLARALGASGVVIGALLPTRKVDRVATARLAGASRPMSVTFHRAIDMTPGSDVGRRGDRARGRARNPLDGGSGGQGSGGDGRRRSSLAEREGRRRSVGRERSSRTGCAWNA
jgi:hypothetical protein